MLDEEFIPDVESERVLLIGVYGPETARVQADEYLDELALLTRTAGGSPVARVLQNKMQPDPNTYVGKGKTQELQDTVYNESIDTLIFDDDLTPTQVRNIEKQTHSKVLDRSGLILDIFASRAKTSAAKTQVELAQLQYLLPRLTRFWTHLSRQKGGIGTKGPGETQIETDRRIINKRITNLKGKLEKIEKQRVTQRKGRSDMKRVSLVGYTNAGKSTLMNALTETKLLAEDRLFATLDSTVRRHEVGNYTMLLSDTVGFIRKLPHHLIESFKSTLDEIRETDILLHVVDASSQLVYEYIDVVMNTLSELGADDKKIIHVFNKVDQIESGRIKQLRSDYPNGVFISASRGIGLDKLEDALVSTVEHSFVTKSVRIPMSDYKAVSFLYEVGNVLDEKYDGNYVDLTFKVEPHNYEKFKDMTDSIVSEETVT